MNPSLPHLPALGRALFLMFLVVLRAGAAEGPPAITVQPAGITVLQGNQAMFSVTVDGTAPFTYQWLRNGAPIAGATASSHTRTAVPADNEAVFSVLVTNSMGNTASSNATLRVDPGMPGSSYNLNLIPLSSQSWRYWANGTDLGTAWRASAFNDAAWPAGQALLGVEAAGVYAEPFRTVFSPYNAAIVTYYFRTHFNFNPTGNVHGVLLSVSGNIDDGAAFYLNGTEIGRVRLAAGAVFGTLATGDNEGGTENFTYVATTELVPGDNVLAVEVHQQSTASSDIVFGIGMTATVTNRVPDSAAPVIANRYPLPGQTVPSLYSAEVIFNEPVQGVDASDFRINGAPATNIIFGVPGQFIFEFPQPPTGSVAFSFTNTHGITDYAAAPNAFAGASWNCILDPNFNPGSFRITEFMAENDNGIRDEDGDNSDWIEIYNPGLNANLQGHFLTDDPLDKTKWRFPFQILNNESYLYVWASSKDRTNTAGGLKMHTSFSLNASGGYLALVDPNTNVISVFDPYPNQVADSSYGRDLVVPDVTGFYSTPTPGAANATQGAGFAPAVTFSHSSRTFVSGQPFQLTLSTPGVPGASIRYVLNTNVPTATSTLYTGPLNVSATTIIRARAFAPSVLPGPVATKTFIALSPTSAGSLPGANNVLSFNSGLPIMILHNHGQGTVPANSEVEQHVSFQVFDNDRGRASMTNLPTLTGRAIFHARGSSTLVASSGKAQFFFETRDEAASDLAVPLMGLPEESDWVLYAPNNFEPGIIHNPLAHAWYRDLDRYGSRTRFFELYLQDDTAAGGAIVPGDYHGIYVLEEKIKRDANRVNITRLDAEDTAPHLITGGYALSIDRADAGEPSLGGLNFGTPAPINFVEPNGDDMALPNRAAQVTYIRDYLNTFNTTLNSVNWTNPLTGYAAYIDIDSWVDLHIHEVITFNVDAMRLSGYFYKDRGKKLEYGPTWDYDRTQGSTDGRDANPRTWRSQTGDLGTDFFNFTPWWGRLLSAPDFWQAWIDRYQELREGTNVLSTNNIFNHITRLAGECTEAHPRELSRWNRQPRGAGGTGTGTFATETQWKRNWYSNRLDFADGQFLAKPSFDVQPGAFSNTFTLTITPVTGLGDRRAGSQLFVTLDGTDPRLSGGAIATGPNVISNTPGQPIVLTISNTVRVFARCRNTAHVNNTGANNPPISSPWSGPVSGTFYHPGQTPPLRITEIMYHPPDAPPGIATNNTENFEYLEFKNISGASLDVTGFRLRGGVHFDFPSLTLASGQSCVVVADMAGFQSRYGTNNPAILVAGSYTNNPGQNRLGNSGDHLVLQGRYREPILDFDYSDGWYPSTDGAGFALQIVDASAATATWGLKESWRAGASILGSPGTNDPAATVIAPIVINEILTHTDLPQVDAIELFNPTGADVDVGGWFLTDDFSQPKRHRIAPGTMVPTGGHLVLYSSNSFGGTFDLASRGEEIYLYSGDANTNLTGYVHGFDFGAQANGVTFGRYFTSSGIQYPAQAGPTLGAANGPPKVGPIVISEIMYHPPDISTIEGPRNNAADEYVELQNITGQPQALFDTNNPANTWRLRDAVSFTFPTNLVLPAGGHLLVVSFDPVADPFAAAGFRSRNGVLPSTPVLGPYGGQLDNSGDSVELTRPDVPQPPEAPDAGAVYQILADKVNYSDSAPWPEAADGFGFSLQRLVAAAFGNDSTNWAADFKTPGYGYNSADRPVITMHPQSTNVLGSRPASFSVMATGMPPIFYQWFFGNSGITGATNSTYTIPSVSPGDAGPYRCLVQNSGGATFSSNAVLGYITPPSITFQPTNVVVRIRPDPISAPSTNAFFRVAASTAVPPLSYHWRKDGVSIDPLQNPSAVSNLLVITNVTVADDGIYDCAVTDGTGTIYCQPALLKPRITPQWIVLPVSQTNIVSVPITLSMMITSWPPPFHYVARSNLSYATTVVTTNSSAGFVRVTDVAHVPFNMPYRVIVSNSVPTGANPPSPDSINLIITNFTVADLDGDGMPDFYEQTYAGDPVAFDPNGDLDGDGMRNRDEYGAGTDPNDNLSFLRIDLAALPGASTLSFGAAPGRSYTIQYADELPAAPWQRLADFVSRTNARVEMVVDPAWTTNRFYRVTTPRAP